MTHSQFRIITLVILNKGHVIIDTRNGKVRGDIRNTSTDNCYGAFEGIPYAEPPIGNHRFLRPRPKQSWTKNEILDVSEEKIVYCIQPDGSKYHPNIGTEDCLYLWVYSPASCKRNDPGIHIQPNRNDKQENIIYQNTILDEEINVTYFP